MARFCTRCGRPLEEGEVCNCGQEAAPQPEVAQQQAAPQPEVAQQEAAPQPEAVQQQAAPQFQQQTQQQAAPQFQQQAQQQGYAQNSQQFQQQTQQQAAPQFQQQAQQQGYAQNSQQFQQQTQQQAAPQSQQQAQQQGYAQNSQQFQQTQQAVTGFLGKMFGSFLNIIKHPVTGGRDVILAGGVAVGSALMVLQGILTAIFAAIGANKAFGDMVGVVSYFSFNINSFGDIIICISTVIIPWKPYYEKYRFLYTDDRSSFS